MDRAPDRSSASTVSTAPERLVNFVWIEFIALLPLCVVLPTLYAAIWWMEHQPRPSLPTPKALRLPGDSLDSQLKQALEVTVDRLVWVVICGLIVAISIVSRRLPATGMVWDAQDTLILTGGLVLSTLLTWRIVRRLPEINQIRRDIRARQTTALEICEVLAGQNRIIHDLQAGDIHIDHVVVTSAGIFAVKTRPHPQPSPDHGAEEFRLQYDGVALHFPEGIETTPLRQVRQQAEWLSHQLFKATGERFPVLPVLAVSGWYVEDIASIGDDMVRVINPKKSHWLFTKGPTLLDNGTLQRATQAVEKLAENVSAPRAR